MAGIRGAKALTKGKKRGKVLSKNDEARVVARTALNELLSVPARMTGKSAEEIAEAFRSAGYNEIICWGQ